MTLLFAREPGHSEEIDEEIRRRLPYLIVRRHPDSGDPADIKYFLGYDPPAGLLDDLPNLKLIFSTGAGADPLVRQTRGMDIPIIRMVDGDLSDLMAQFVTAQALAWHRDLWRYREQQAVADWRPHAVRLTRDRKIGVLGTGAIGATVIRYLRSVGFDVAGWGRTPKALGDVPVFTGQDGLDIVLQRSEILVSVLPATDETREILNAATLRLLPPGAVLINVGRGANLREADLLALLDGDRLSGAMLDVFSAEPLNCDHPFWRHPKIVVTPHVAGAIRPAAMAQVVCEQISRFEAGLPVQHLVDRERGY